MLRPIVSIVLIVLLVLAPTVCQAHAHESALAFEHDEAGTRTSGPYLPPHFHDHHLWFVDFFDSDHDSEEPCDDHDSLPGQQIAAIFAGHSLLSPERAQSLHAVVVVIDLDSQATLAPPLARCHSPPRHFVVPCKRPLYLTTLNLRI